MTLTLNKSFSSPIVEGVPFGQVQLLINFDASPISAIVGGTIDGTNSRATSPTVFSSAGSAYFTGDTGDNANYWVNFADLENTNALGQFGSDPFMIELCCYPTNVGGIDTIFLLGGYYWSPIQGMGIEARASGIIRFNATTTLQNSGVNIGLMDTTTTMSNDNWYYYCVAGSGTDGGSGTVSCYIGALTDSVATREAQSTYTVCNSYASNIYGRTTIGASIYSGRPAPYFYAGFKGYIDNVRVVKGTDTTNQDTSIPMITEQFPTS